MSELPDVSGGETIAAGFTNNVKNRTVMRYANAAARDASIPIPVDGDLAFLIDVDDITFFGAGVWHQLMDLAESDARYVNRTGDTMTGALSQAAGAVVAAAAAGGIQTRWNGDGDADLGFRRYVWRRSAAFGELELWGYDANNDGQIVFSISANVGAKHLNSQGGIIAQSYSQLPASGKDEFWFQMRGITISDIAPVGGDGQDGDVWVQTGASNRVWGKVAGVWV